MYISYKIRFSWNSTNGDYDTRKLNVVRREGDKSFEVKWK